MHQKIIRPPSTGIIRGGVVLASDFEQKSIVPIGLISQNPLRCPRFGDERRCLIVRKFPYSIIYELGGEEVVVLAVAHGRRKPNYWRERETTYGSPKARRGSSRYNGHPGRPAEVIDSAIEFALWGRL